MPNRQNTLHGKRFQSLRAWDKCLCNCWSDKPCVDPGVIGWLVSPSNRKCGATLPRCLVRWVFDHLHFTPARLSTWTYIMPCRSSLFGLLAFAEFDKGNYLRLPLGRSIVGAQVLLCVFAFIFLG
jgi:hypothetical protein